MESNEAYREQVLKTFWKDGLVLLLPSDKEMRKILLLKIAEDFEPGRSYSELEVNFKILDHYDDYRLVRKELIDSGILTKTRGQYIRPAGKEN